MFSHRIFIYCVILLCLGCRYLYKEHNFIILALWCIFDSLSYFVTFPIKILLKFDITNYFDLTCDEKYTYVYFCVQGLLLIAHPVALIMFYDDDVLPAQLICTMYCGMYLHLLFCTLLKMDFFDGDLFN